MYWLDLAGGYFSNAGILESMKEMKKIGDAGMKYPIEYRPDVALLYSTESAYYLRENSRALTSISSFNLRCNAALAGLSYDQYLLEDILENNFPEYKCYIFINAFAPSPKIMDAINRKLKKNGAYLIWGYAPGMFKDGNISLENMKELTGFEFSIKMEETPLLLKTCDNENPILKGFKDKIFGASSKVGPFFYISGSDSLCLGKMQLSGLTGFALKKMNGWTSVYCAYPGMSPELFRNIFREAGCHIFTEGNDSIYYNGRFIGIYTSSHGRKNIFLPSKTNIYNVFHRKNIAYQTNFFEAELPAAKAELYFLGTEEEWNAFSAKIEN